MTTFAQVLILIGLFIMACFGIFGGFIIVRRVTNVGGPIGYLPGNERDPDNEFDQALARYSKMTKDLEI